MRWYVRMNSKVNAVRTELPGVYRSSAELCMRLATYRGHQVERNQLNSKPVVERAAAAESDAGLQLTGEADKAKLALVRL